MTAILKGSYEEATRLTEKLKAFGFYACLSGNRLAGYEVLVRHATVGACKEHMQMSEANAGGNA